MGELSEAIIEPSCNFPIGAESPTGVAATPHSLHSHVCKLAMPSP
jgi:hypothetical protein